MSKTKPGFLNEWKNIISPMEPSVNAGLNTGILFFVVETILFEKMGAKVSIWVNS